MKRYYIAYGSNINIYQMYRRCPSAQVLGTATLKGWELLFKGSKTGFYLTIEPNASSEIPVVVWSVTEEDEQMLDLYEGCPTYYYKRRIRLRYKGICTGRLRQITGFAYIMHEDSPMGIPTARYMDICLDGYRIFDFDRRKLYEARLKSVNAESKERTFVLKGFK